MTFNGRAFVEMGGVKAIYGYDPEGNVIGRRNGGLDSNFLDSTEGWNIPLPRRFTFSTRVTF